MFVARFIDARKVAASMAVSAMQVNVKYVRGIEKAAWMYGNVKTRNSLLLISFLKGILALASSFSVPKTIVLKTEERLTHRAFIANACMRADLRIVRYESDRIMAPAVIGIMNARARITRWKNFNKMEIPKVYIVGDFHRDTEKRLKYVEENDIDLVLVRYKQWMKTPKVKKWIKRKKMNARWLPHCANTRIFKDYDLSRSFDVVSSGRCSQDVYPFRVVIRDTLSTTPNIRFLMPKHVTYELIKGKSPSEVLMFENYAKFLFRSKIFIFGSSIYNYALAKYTDGMACNTLVRALMPYGWKRFTFCSR
jgi:hypothetical protein